jgi:acyl carrier protein
MTTLAILQDLLIQEFDLTREQVAPEADLSGLGIDSLDMLELMFKIEDRYQLAIREDIPSNLQTVQDVVAYIDGLVARRGPPVTPDADLHATG